MKNERNLGWEMDHTLNIVYSSWIIQIMNVTFYGMDL